MLRVVATSSIEFISGAVRGKYTELFGTMRVLFPGKSVIWPYEPQAILSKAEQTKQQQALAAAIYAKFGKGWSVRKSKDGLVIGRVDQTDAK